ncbi:YHS domain-containing (seleno)protein [uncultured Paracoccus sp.]|uniref:YHS domain-containing (seleno)protein n=1 Tax=uncultured Paracoccus sp. TaxID=189685 RepID=UPI0026024ADF|nr:YHS domain-containing (seleno)protein [uncultured Paracoccus sp.]
MHPLLRLPHLLWVAAAALTLAALPTPSVAQNWAVGGLDAVELFSSGRPIAGRSDLGTVWKGRTWLFASEPNRSAFEANPRRFAPALGGLCPASLAEGARVPGRPELAVVIGGRMYLPSSVRHRSILLADPDGVLAAARAAAR